MASRHKERVLEFVQQAVIHSHTKRIVAHAKVHRVETIVEKKTVT